MFHEYILYLKKKEKVQVPKSLIVPQRYAREAPLPSPHPTPMTKGGHRPRSFLTDSVYIISV